MGEVTDKLKAAGNKAAGAVKEGIGKATDNDRTWKKCKSWITRVEFCHDG